MIKTDKEVAIQGDRWFNDKCILNQISNKYKHS